MGCEHTSTVAETGAHSDAAPLSRCKHGQCRTQEAPHQIWLCISRQSQTQSLTGVQYIKIWPCQAASYRLNGPGGVARSGVVSAENAAKPCHRPGETWMPIANSLYYPSTKTHVLCPRTDRTVASASDGRLSTVVCSTQHEVNRWATQCIARATRYADDYACCILDVRAIYNSQVLTGSRLFMFSNNSAWRLH